MRVTCEVVAGETHDLDLPDDAVYGDVIRAVGFSEHEAAVLVDDSPVPEDAPVAVERVRLLRLVQGGDGEADTVAAADAGTSAAEAFALLGEPTRFAILRAIWETETPTSFSEIRDAVGTGDTGRFNYHLGKLRGEFVRKTESGYELRQAGVEVVRAVLAGVVNEAPERDPEPIGATCPAPDCEGDLVVAYDDHATVTCGTCDTVWMDNEFPPAGVTGRDAPALARALDRWTRHRSLLAFDGVCPACASETAATVEETERGTFLERVCGHCGHASRAPLWALALHHPEVSGFLHDHGVEVADRPFWEVAAVDAETTATDEGFVCRFSLDGGTLRVTLDGDGAVVRTERDD